MEDFAELLSGDADRCEKMLGSLKTGRVLFALVMSYTRTCEIPGITVAGADRDLVRLTPAADAEYLHYGHCKSIDGIPMTPDGKPTPGLLTKAALESASIPHLAINAGCAVPPQLPFIDAGMSPGGDISAGDAMDVSEVAHAVDYGRIVGRSLASLADCLVIGESIPGGTTTALAVLRALGFSDARVSSSMPENPTGLKDGVARVALGRVGSDHPYEIMAGVGDPMIPFVAGMLGAASGVSRVMLAGGTQMAAVLAFASRIGFGQGDVAVGTTVYVANDKSANLADLLGEISPDIPAISVDPGLENSRFSGLGAFARGFAKEGVGAGGAMIASMQRTGGGRRGFLDAAEKEYGRLFAMR